MHRPKSRSGNGVAVRVGSSRHGITLFVWFAGWLLAAAAAEACNIPVFRYALERWRPDAFEAVVFHHGPLTEQQLELIQTWRQRSAELAGRDDRAGEPVNFEIALADRATELPREVQQIWEAATHGLAEPPDLPWVVFRAPGARRVVRVAFSGPLSDATWTAAGDSPLRRELRQRLLAGHAVVWMWLPGRSADENSQLEKLLAERLPLLEQEISLPEGIGTDGIELLSDVPLEIKFSALRIDTADPAERALVAMLRAHLPAANDDQHPVLLPVFGCGRVLDAIPGQDVDADVLADAAQFLCGACSCQVKNLNPGFDLLLAADWDRLLAVAGSSVVESPASPAPAAPAEPKYVPIPRTVTKSNGAAAAPGPTPAAAAPPAAVDTVDTTVRRRVSRTDASNYERWPPSVTAVMLGIGALALVIMTVRIIQRRRNRRQAAT